MDRELDQLFEDYNYYRLHTHKVYDDRLKGRWVTKRLKDTPERRRALSSMVRFCHAHEADPRLWLYSLFKSRRWLYSPPFNQLTPRANIRRYRELAGASLFEARVRQEITQRRRVDPNRDLLESAEAQKRAYRRAGREVLCVEDMQATYGYHPESRVCPGCALADECRRRLQQLYPFDIVAYRRGELELTTEQAMYLAGTRGHHGRPTDGRERQIPI